MNVERQSRTEKLENVCGYLFTYIHMNIVDTRELYISKNYFQPRTFSFSFSSFTHTSLSTYATHATHMLSMAKFAFFFLFVSTTNHRRRYTVCEADGSGLTTYTVDKTQPQRNERVRCIFSIHRVKGITGLRRSWDITFDGTLFFSQNVTYILGSFIVTVVIWWTISRFYIIKFRKNSL